MKELNQKEFRVNGAKTLVLSGFVSGGGNLGFPQGFRADWRSKNLVNKLFCGCADAKAAGQLSSQATKLTLSRHCKALSLPQVAREHALCAKRTVKNFSLLTFHFSREGKRVAFTLAEVLITLGIIGVVAALTLPSVIEKHQKQVTVNKLKKVYSTLSQFVVRTYADNGPASDYLSAGERLSADKTEQFFEIYWKPYFNGMNIAENGKNFYNKSIPYTYLNDKSGTYNSVTGYSSARVTFSTQDGFIYHVKLMEWKTDEEGKNIALYSNHQTIYVDINGIKPPNKVGKDVFLFQVDFEKNIVQPLCYSSSSKSIDNDCSPTGYGTCCAAKIIKDGWQINY